MRASESSVPEVCASTFAKSCTCGVVKPTQPCEANVPNFAGDLPPWINEGKPIGILIGPSGFSLLPASTFSPTLTFFIFATQGSSGGVQVGLKMMVRALRRPVGSGNCGYPMPIL